MATKQNTDRLELTIEQLANAVIVDGITKTTVKKQSTGQEHNLTFDWTGVDGQFILDSLTDQVKTLRVNRKIDEAAQLQADDWYRRNKETNELSKNPVSESVRKNAERFLQTDITVNIKSDIVDAARGAVSEEKVVSDVQKAIKKLMGLGYTREQAIEKILSDTDDQE